MQKPLTFQTLFLGCKVNSYEVECVANDLINAGYTSFLSSEEDAEPSVFIINTCAVTETSVNKDKKMIRHYRTLYPNSIFIVMGCYSQYDYKYVSEILNADIVIGTNRRVNILSLINDYKSTNGKIIQIDDEKDVKKYESIQLNKFLFNTRAYLKIQDGCNNFCSYCLIPYVRGRSRSRKKEDVLSEVGRLIDNGYSEVVLTGIDTASYGLDLYDDYTFSDMVEEILVSYPNLYRLRISSIEESQIDDKFLKLLAIYPQIADHLHIPLQNGSENVLKRMNRKYNLVNYVKKINAIREIRPDIALSTDVIIGFPGESEDDFLMTYNFIKEIGYSKVHAFPYSPRKNTVAEKLDNQIPQEVKKDRTRCLIALSNTLEKRYKSKFIGKEIEFLFESFNEKDGKYKGHSSNFLEISVKSSVNLCGRTKVVKYK